MPQFQDVILTPGVNVQLTKELNQAGISVSQLIRFKTGLAQKQGGWSNYFPTPISSTPVRDIHAFQGLTQNRFLAAGSLTSLVIISCGALINITPQTNDTNPTPSFSIAAGSNIVTVIDPGSSAPQYGAVRFDTPISLGGQVLSSAYPVNTAVDANTYTIAVDKISSTTVSSGGTLPTFQVSAGSAVADVVFPSAAYLPVLGLYYPFRAPTTLGPVIVQGAYPVTSVIDSTRFQINLGVASSAAAGPVTMNSSRAALHYYNTQAPPLPGGAFGAGAFGAGAFGLGTAAGSGTGTPIVVTDWSLDNAGEFLIAVPKNGPLYYWAPDTNLQTAQVVATGPLFNLGGFVSQPQQIVMMFGSTQITGTQDPLLMRWSESGDFTNWRVTPTTAAGSFRIPSGSTLVGALQAPLFAVAWTDIDVWTATWAGQPLIWAWLRVGTGCGLIGQHAADVQNGVPYWCGPSNFYTMGPSGVQVVPCTVWDFIFQNIDKANQSKVRCASNSFFNEITWFFPVAGGNGENSAYVKLHIDENGGYQWDYGMLSRTSWVDTTVLGPPIGTDASGNVLQHEMSFDASGSPVNAYLETGYFEVGDGTDIPLVDWCLPDLKWGTGQAGTSGIVLFTFFAADYPGDTELTYGPFTVTQATQFINLRIRKRFLRMRIESNDLGTFWRIGRVKFRFGISGSR